MTTTVYAKKLCSNFALSKSKGWGLPMRLTGKALFDGYVQTTGLFYSFSTFGSVLCSMMQPSRAEMTEPNSTPSLAWLSMVSPAVPRLA